jgi:hypothetical protein
LESTKVNFWKQLLRAYIKWLASHKNVLSVEHRGASDAAKELLEGKVEAPRAEYWDDNRACLCYRDTRKPTGSLEGIDFGDTPMRWNAQEECFEEVPNVKVDLGLKGNLNVSMAFSILR